MAKKIAFEVSKTPLEHIEMMAYPGQEPTRRMYKAGYEGFMAALPVLHSDDLGLDAKFLHTQVVMDGLAQELVKDNWIANINPESKGFMRTIIAVENPLTTCNGLPNGKMVVKEGAELIVAHWGDGHTSPVHGHSDGFIHEHILSGKMRVNTYRIVDEDNRIVRPIRTDIITEGTFASVFVKSRSDNKKRMNLVHNFTSVGVSHTLHFIPEHTRDGRDNMFSVEHFEDSYNMTVDDVTLITSKQGLYSRIGDVLLVRSPNVPEYGDHFIVITGHPVVKEHGLRPQDIAVQASPNAYSLLDFYETFDGLVLLKLNETARQAFFDFHNITMVNGEVKFPEA